MKKLIKKLDDVFSKYIRLKNADENGIVKCYTCGKYHHWKEIQCGHYISRRHFGTRWEEKNCKPQCVGCNIFNQGSADTFARNLIREYGSDILELLAAKKNNITKLGGFELNFMISDYQARVNKLGIKEMNT